MDEANAMIPIDLDYELASAVYLLLASLIILYLCWHLYSVRSKEKAKLGAPEVLAVILEPRSSLTFWMKSLAMVILWICAVVALMGPKGNARYPEEASGLSKISQQNKTMEMRRPAHDVVFLIDASASMYVKDSRNGSSRLDLAKDIADQILSRLSGQNAALDAFTSELTQLSPLTLDYLFVRLMLRRIQINEGGIPGTDVKTAFEELMKQYFETPVQRLRTIILLSDGGDTLYESLEGEAKAQRKKEILSFLDRAERDHLRVFVVGMGSKQGEDVPGMTYQGQPVHSAIDEVLLAAISSHGRGEFYDANQRSAVDIADNIVKQMKQDNPYFEKTAWLGPSTSTNKFKVYDYYYQLPLAIAILWLLFVIFFPEVKRKKMMASFLGFYFISIPYLEAQTYAESMQTASSAYEAEDYAKSMEIYQDLLTNPLSSWQQAVILYDLGAVYLAAGQNLKALALFNSINLGEDPQRLLLKEIRTDQAIAYLNESQAIKGSSLDELNKKFFYLQESLHAIHSAQVADCELQKAEGSLVCESADDLIWIEQTITYRLSDFYNQIKKYVDSINLTQKMNPLNRLLILYRIVLIGDLMTQKLLLLLHTEQQKIGQTFLDNQKERLKKANEGLDKSIESYAQETKIAKFYLLKAFQQLVLIQRSLQEPLQKLPATILDNVIEDQRQSLQMNRLLHEIGKEGKIFVDSQENPQENVLETAKSFLSIVKQYQIGRFANKGKKTPEECCQAQPWDEVIPLFDQGYQYAEQAGQLSGLSSLLSQEKALSTWMQAKQMLDLPVKPHKGSCFAAKEATQEQPSSAENKSAAAPLKPSFEQVERELERMDKADSALEQAPVQSVKVERPW
jgi:Ca-activated chloride channel family protein